MSAAPETFPSRFRPMAYADVREVIAIEERVYPFPWTETIFKDCLRVGYCCRVLEVNGRIEAYGIMSTGAGEAHVLNLCVRPEAQSRGLARRLLKHLFNWARLFHIKTVFLEVRPSNVRAVRLYQRMGFCEVGIRKSYYPDTNGREDALVMAMEL